MSAIFWLTGKPDTPSSGTMATWRQIGAAGHGSRPRRRRSTDGDRRRLVSERWHSDLKYRSRHWRQKLWPHGSWRGSRKYWAQRRQVNTSWARCEPRLPLPDISTDDRHLISINLKTAVNIFSTLEVEAITHHPLDDIFHNLSYFGVSSTFKVTFKVKVSWMSLQGFNSYPESCSHSL